MIIVALESPSHALIDNALRSLPVALPVLDFTTTKQELFPVISNVFTKTNSLGIKVRVLESFVVLCGGTSSTEDQSGNDLDGLSAESQKESRKPTGTAILDKFTMQEKVVPLIKGIKTREPAVMMAAKNVLRHVGDVADAEFVAMDILPIL